MSTPTTVRQRTTKSTGNEDLVKITNEGEQRDKELDKHDTYVGESFPRFSLRLTTRRSYEFGGPWGVFAIMTGFSVLMYYLWTCLWFYDGRLVYPHSLAEAKPLFLEILGHIKTVRFGSVFRPHFLTP